MKAKALAPDCWFGTHTLAYPCTITQVGMRTACETPWEHASETERTLGTGTVISIASATRDHIYLIIEGAQREQIIIPKNELGHLIVQTHEAA